MMASKLEIFDYLPSKTSSNAVLTQKCKQTLSNMRAKFKFISVWLSIAWQKQDWTRIFKRRQKSIHSRTKRSFFPCLKIMEAGVMIWREFSRFPQKCLQQATTIERNDNGDDEEISIKLSSSRETAIFTLTKFLFQGRK